MLLHGWPGSLIEFLSVIEPLRNRGFSVVVPSLPGYAWSDKPPTDRHFGIEECAKVVDALMRGLGYMEYAVQVSLDAPAARVALTRKPGRRYRLAHRQRAGDTVLCMQRCGPPLGRHVAELTSMPKPSTPTTRLD